MSQAVGYCHQVVGLWARNGRIAVTSTLGSVTLNPGECYQSGRFKVLPKASVAQLTDDHPLVPTAESSFRVAESMGTRDRRMVASDRSLRRRDRASFPRDRRMVASDRSLRRRDRSLRRRDRVRPRPWVTL